MKLGINRKQLGVTLVIIGLMALLFSSEVFFKEKLNEVALLDSDMKIMKLIKIKDGAITYKLPESFEYKEKYFPSDTIISYNDYNSKNKVISGFLSIEKSQEHINNIINKDKELIEEAYKVKGYKVLKVNLESKEAIRVNYEYSSQDIGNYIAREYYLTQGEYVVRFTFYVVKNKYKDTMLIAFNNIVKSLALNLQN